MFKLFRRYIFSISLIIVVVYLSFFHNNTSQYKIPFANADKVVHFLMYGCLSTVIWLEFMFNHRDGSHMKNVWLWAVFFPILMSGIIEILQSTLTTYRSGEYLDFLANTVGVTLATWFCYFIIRPFVVKIEEPIDPFELEEQENEKKKDAFL